MLMLTLVIDLTYAPQLSDIATFVEQCKRHGIGEDDLFFSRDMTNQVGGISAWIDFTPDGAEPQ